MDKNLKRLVDIAVSTFACNLTAFEQQSLKECIEMAFDAGKIAATRERLERPQQPAASSRSTDQTAWRCDE